MLKLGLILNEMQNINRISLIINEPIFSPSKFIGSLFSDEIIESPKKYIFTLASLSSYLSNGHQLVHILKLGT